jgi:predicted ATPase/class 3 adenylate cyclase
MAMADAAAGAVTFVFTDVEGSTSLLRRLGGGYVDALDRHRRAIREAFAARGGYEVDTQGDAFFFVFSSAAAAVAAVEAGQRALHAGLLSVRMGIHTGEATRTRDGYVGLDVHKAARIAAAAHGGQVVLSQATRNSLDDDVAVLDLGEHRVKDFEEPVWLFQLGVESFPPLRTISNTNLPRPASSFVGRAQEVAEVIAHVRQGARLLTLTGPGGSGKTRLGIEAASSLVPEFRGGVFWIGLASVDDAGLVRETIARTLGARGDLEDHIGERELLLLLDNFEGVVAAAPELSQLLETCENLHLLVTSRELLRLRGEVEYPVLPLADREAAELFAARAQIQSDATVVELCQALDNLPLAVELAAARAHVLSPAQTLERLGQRLDLFRGGRDVEPRQATLRATIEWSHELLTADEQHLFARLAAFVGGCTLAAAEAVAEADIDTLDGLVRKSLVRHSGERFWMLETIRAYALERLEQCDDADTIRSRHAEYFLRFAERAEDELDGEQQGVWLERIEQDYANVRTALGVPDVALRLAGAIRMFWPKRGYQSEGRRLLAEILARADDADPAKPKALFAAALLAVMQADWAEAERLGAASRELSLRHGDRRIAAQSLLVLGRAVLADGDDSQAAALFEQAVTLGAEIGRPTIVTMAHLNLGYLALQRGDYRRASRDFDLARERAAAIGDPHAGARALAGLASAALHEDRINDAIDVLLKSLRLSGPLGDKDNIAWALQLLGVASAHTDHDRAALLLGAAETLRADLGESLEGVELALHEHAVSQLDLERLTATWAAGRRLPLKRAIELALDAPARAEGG